ncbi:MAG: S-adenosylmethionine decarboxylase [Euryarchaeota archaeon]|nr:S-adenosylmethionine decarboxylase [Euryarchaeota archaeon]
MDSPTSHPIKADPAGKHVFIDFVNFHSKKDGTGYLVLSVLRKAVKDSGVREVHHHCENFDGTISPPGFAAVVLIDESHVTAHCYGISGILAVDVFTCGDHDPNAIADEITKSLERICPEIIVTQRQEISRFVQGV